LDLLVARVRFENSAVPASRPLGVSDDERDVSEVAKSYQVFGVEGESGLEHCFCFLELPRLV
jgi:hypothetical protein